MQSTNGWISRDTFKLPNLQVTQALDVSGSALFKSTLSVAEDVFIEGISLSIFSDTYIEGNLSLYSEAYLEGGISISNFAIVNCTLDVSGAATFKSNVDIEENLEVYGDSILHNNLSVGGNLTVNSLNVQNEIIFNQLDVSGSTTTQNLEVAQTTTLNETTVLGEISMYENVLMKKDVDITGLLSVGEDAFFGGYTTTIDGDAFVNGLLSVDSEVYLLNELSVGGAVILNSTISVNDLAKFNVIDASSLLQLNVTGNSNLTVLSVSTMAYINNRIDVSGNANISSYLSVGEDTFLEGITLSIFSDTYIEGILSVDSEIYLSAELSVGGRAIFSGEVDVNSISKFSNTVSIGSTAIINADLSVSGHIYAAEPTQASHVATKSYVDSLSAGLDPKESVRLASTANITGTANNSLLTFTVTAPSLTIDGSNVELGNRILLKNQVNQTENGIYVVSGLNGSSVVFTRSSDFNNDPIGEISPGAFFFSEQGTANSNTGWVVNALYDLSGQKVDPSNVVFGSTKIIFSQFTGAGSIVGGAGVNISGSTVAVNVDNSTIEVNGSNQIQIKDSGVTLSKLELATSGLNHNLDIANLAIKYSVISSNKPILANGEASLCITDAGGSKFLSLVYNDNGDELVTNLAFIKN